MKRAFVVTAFVATVSLASFAQGKGVKPSPTSRSSVSFHNPDSIAKPASNYSHIAEVPLGPGAGKLVYISGQVALDKSGNLVGKDDFKAQVEQIFLNLKSAVEAAGGNFHDVVKLNFFCAESVDASQVPAVREVRDKYINTSAPPTSTFVFVKRLIRSEWMLEVEAVAVVKPK